MLMYTFIPQKQLVYIAVVYIAVRYIFMHPEGAVLLMLTYADDRTRQHVNVSRRSIFSL
jgi:hypothetical protein